MFALGTLKSPHLVILFIGIDVRENHLERRSAGIAA